MKKLYILAILYFLSNIAIAQYYELGKNPFDEIKAFTVLKDKNYTFEQVLNDSTLPFTTNNVLQDFKTTDYYWLKATFYNPSKYAQTYYVRALPQLEDSLFYYDDEQAKWLTNVAGLSVPSHTRRYSVMPVVFQGQQKSTLYFKIKVTGLANEQYTTKARIFIEKKSYYDEVEVFIKILWITTLVIMLMFFIYNAYLYVIFSDNTYLYYLMILIGGALYLTQGYRYFNTLSSFRHFNINMLSNGNVYYYDITHGVSSFGTIIVIAAFIQLTRYYLQTHSILPAWDKILKYLLIAFVVIDGLNNTLSLCKKGYFRLYQTHIENISIVLIILLLIYMGIIAHRKKIEPAKYFLIANILPLILMLLLAIYYLNYTNSDTFPVLLPNLAIISHALTFAVALVARVNLIKEELRTKQLEAQILKTEKEHILLENEIEKQVLQRGFSQQLIQTQETEKQRISQELHDSIGQNILFIKNQLRKKNADNHLSPILETVNNTIEEVRNIAKDLYPNQLEKYGLAAAVEALGEKVAESTGIFVSADFQLVEKYLSKPAAIIHIYRIVQESLNNAVKHSGATALRITGEKRGDKLHFLIQDNGKGFDMAILEKKQQRSFGLLGIEERVKILGGDFEIESIENQGTKIQFTVNGEQ